MGKLRKTVILRISESHLKYIVAATIKEKKSKSRIIREAIENQISNEKNR
jgi:predicted DNA-binding protein